METVLATIGDSEGIALAHVSAWQRAYRGVVPDTFLDAMNVRDGATRWASVIQSPENAVVVAKSQGQVQGFITFGKHREEGSSPLEAEIWTMYVHPRFWRAGVGTRLMNHAIDSLAASGFKSIWVWVLAANEQAKSFYAASGFNTVPSKRRNFLLGEHSLEEVAMLRNAA